MDETKIAEALEAAFNGLAKTHNWPNRMEKDHILRSKRRALAKITRELAKTGEECGAYLQWILKRWNWNKSPAPLALCESPDQWNALRWALTQTKKEADAAKQEAMEKLERWAKREFARYREKGLPPAECRRLVEEFAKATGRTNGLGTTERLHMQQTLEELCHA